MELEQTRETDAAVDASSLSEECFVQLRFLLFPGLLIRPPAHP